MSRAFLLASLPFLLVACAPESTAPVEPAAADIRDAEGQERAAIEGVAVVDAWTRALPPGAKVAGGFMTLRNGGDHDDRLLSIISPAAGRVEVHEMKMADGMMQMRQLAEGLPLPAGSEVVLKPGGYHLMFIEPDEGFVEGGEIPATLSFEHAGEQEVVFKVMPLGATSIEPESHDEPH